MALVPHRHARGQQGLGEQVSLGTASRHGVATLASASEAETIAKQPPGPRLQYNWLQNCTFNQDSRYPAAGQTHNRTKNAFNGKSGINTGNAPPNHWARYCPLFTSTATNDYYTILNNYFLRSRKKDDTYLDIAAENTTGTASGSSHASEYNIGPAQHRILGLYGTSNHLNSRNNNPDRNYTDLPVYGATTGEIDSSSTFADGDGWVKHCYYQIIQNFPAEAVKAKYGAYVQVTEDDDFADKNFASIRVSQDWYNPSNPYAANYTRKVYGQEYKIFKVGDINDLPNSIGTHTNLAYTNYNWNGPSKDIVSGQEHNPGVSWPFLRWPTHLDIQGGSGAMATIHFREFKLVTETYTLEPGSSAGIYSNQLGDLLFELCFFEHSSNLVTATGNSTPSGSVRFYAPFVQFLDSSDNVITTYSAP